MAEDSFLGGGGISVCMSFVVYEVWLFMMLRGRCLCHLVYGQDIKNSKLGFLVVCPVVNVFCAMFICEYE